MEDFSAEVVPELRDREKLFMPRSGWTGSGGVGSRILDAGENRSKSPGAKMSWLVQEAESHCGRT